MSLFTFFLEFSAILSTLTDKSEFCQEYFRKLLLLFQTAHTLLTCKKCLHRYNVIAPCARVDSRQFSDVPSARVDSRHFSWVAICEHSETYGSYSFCSHKFSGFPLSGFILFWNFSSSLIGPQLGNNWVCRRTQQFVTKQNSWHHVCQRFCWHCSLLTLFTSHFHSWKNSIQRIKYLSWLLLGDKLDCCLRIPMIQFVTRGQLPFLWLGHLFVKKNSFLGLANCKLLFFFLTKIAPWSSRWF